MATSSLEPQADLDEASALDRPRRRSSFAVMRDAVLAATHIVEDSTELIGASVREELEHFRVDIARQALSVIAISIGGVLLTAGLAMFLNELVHNWALTLVLFGGAYLGVALWLQRGGGGEDA